MINPYEIKFQSEGRTFVNNLRTYDAKNSDGKLNGFILDSIKKYAHSDFEGLLKLISKDETVKKYCYLDHPSFKNFWNEFLTSQIVLDNLKKHKTPQLKPQKNIHSLNLIRGFYVVMDVYDIYSKNEEKKISDDKTSFYSSLHSAVSFDSYQGGCLLLHFYSQNKLELEFHEIGQELYPLAQAHKTPGYVLLAKLHVMHENYQQALICLELAKNLLADSTDEIHNAQVTPNQMKNIISELINFSAEHLNKEMIEKAVAMAKNKDQSDQHLLDFLHESSSKSLSLT